MKKLVCAIILLAVTHLGLAQIPTWERQYGKANRAELAWDIVECDGGEFVICGFTLGGLPWDLDGWIIKINAFGDTIWTKQVGSQGLGAGTDFLTCVILNKDNELVFTGNRYQFPFNKQVWFLKYQTNGNLLTEKRIGGSAEDNGNKIIQNSDGSYMIIGDTRSYGSQVGGKDVWLLKLTPEGDTLWTKTYDFGFEDMGTGIISFQNTNYLITSVSCTANCGGLLQQGFATYFVIDSLGEVLKTVSFNQGLKNKFLDVAATHDGGAIITGATSQNEYFPSEDIWLVRLDAKADTMWTKTFGDYHRYDGGFGVFETDDGGYFLAAYSQSVQTPQLDYDNWWIFRLNAAGDSLWTRWWGGPLNDDPYSIIPTSDGGIIIAGWRDANSNPFDSLSIGDANFYIIKTDPREMTSGLRNNSSQLPALVDLHQNYPNPFNPSTTIRFSLPRREYVTLKVFDVLGREVTTLVDGELNAGEHTVVFNAKDLPRGVYFYRLMTPTFIQTKSMEVLK